MNKKSSIISTQDNFADTYSEIDLGVNTHNRIIYIEDAIDVYTARFLDQRIRLIMDKTKNIKDPITLFISSYGGDTFGMFGVLDVINASPMKINTVGIGPVMSAAAYITILATGTRLLGKNSYLMLHSVQSRIQGGLEDIFKQTNLLKTLNNNVLEQVAVKSKKPKSYWLKETKNDLYLDVDKAIELGLIDGKFEIPINKKNSKSK